MKGAILFALLVGLAFVRSSASADEPSWQIRSGESPGTMVIVVDAGPVPDSKVILSTKCHVEFYDRQQASLGTTVFDGPGPVHGGDTDERIINHGQPGATYARAVFMEYKVIDQKVLAYRPKGEDGESGSVGGPDEKVELGQP